MSTWIFLLGFLLFGSGMIRRAQRRDDRKSDLARLERDRKVARFWGFGTANEDKAYEEKLAEHRIWDFKFEAVCWALCLAGGALIAVGTVVWMGEDSAHTWDQVWDNTQKIAFVGVGGFIVYRLLKRSEEAHNEIEWLNLMLKAVKDHAEGMRKGSINNFLELKDRLDRLEGTLPK